MSIFYASKKTGDAMGKETTPWTKKSKQAFAIQKFNEEMNDMKKIREARRGYRQAISEARKAAGLDGA